MIIQANFVVLVVIYYVAEYGNEAIIIACSV